MDDYLWVLKRSELDLIREIEPERMAALDEDDLIALHRRVRRARNKKQKNYRRRAAERVGEAGARGAAAPLTEKHRIRLAAFEEALSRVSARLAEVAHEQAEALKDERLEQSRAGRSSGPGGDGPDGAGAVVDAGRARAHGKSAGGLKRDASSLAQGARRQAARDSR